MGKTTQKDRLLSITTPLGEDYLLINKMRVEEKISELFEIDTELLYDEEEDDAFDITVVDGKDIVGQTVSISIAQDDGGKRTLREWSINSNSSVELVDLQAITPPSCRTSGN